MFPTRIYINISKPYLSPALRRVEEAILLTLPKDYETTIRPEMADVIIQPVVNYKDIDFELSENAIIWQLCYKTAGEEEDFWQYVWDKARFVVSYLDLPTNYLRMPLGYDPDVFKPATDRNLLYWAMTTGHVDDNGAEEIKSVYDAFDQVAHVGHDFKLGPGYTYFHNLSDKEMANLYRQSVYSVALRHIEGFELPLIEGAACGCIPVAFDMECYRHWFNDFALFVDPNNLAEDMRAIRYRERSDEEVEKVLDYASAFTWDKVMKPFWDRIK